MYPYASLHCHTHVNSMESDGISGIYLGGYILASNSSDCDTPTKIAFVQRIDPTSTMAM